MNKTNMIILAVIAVYLIVIFPKMGTSSTSNNEKKEENKSDTKSGTGLSENADKNGVSQGAAGQQKYRQGYVN